jgi:hypothetical protein
MSDNYQKKLALELEIARALPGASEAVIKRIFQNRVAVLSGYELNEAGFLVSLGGGSVKDEVEAMRQSGAYDDLFDEAQPAAQPKEAVATKRPGDLSADDYKVIGHDARLRDMIGTPAPEKRQSAPKAVGLPDGMSREQFQKLDPMQKIAAANEARAKRDGWNYDGFNKDR